MPKLSNNNVQFAVPSDVEVDPNWTYVGVLIDTSGSMIALNPENTSKQLTSLIKEQSDTKVTVTAARFSNNYKVFIENEKPEDIKITAEDIKPDGTTALYESFCRIIDDVTKTIQNFQVKRPGKVVIIVLTDGEENSSDGIYSGENGQKLLTSKINAKKEEKWIFYFLGTNIDAIKMGNGFGISRDTCINYGSSQVGCTNVMKATSQALSRARRSEPESFTQNERNISSKTH